MFVLIGVHHGGYDSILSFMQTYFVGIEDTFIFSTFDGIFGVNGTLPLFTGNLLVMEYYAVYFVIALMMHVLIDVLAFIPRLTHSFMDKYCGGGVQ